MDMTQISKGYFRQILIVLVLVLLVSFPMWMSPYYLTTVVRILYYSILALSLTFLAGQAGMVSLAQTGLFGFSAYALAITSVTLNLPAPFPVVIALGGTVLIGLIFAFLSLRTYGTYYLILTLALGQLLWAVAQQWTSLTGGFDGIQGIRAGQFFGIPLSKTSNFYWLILGVFLAVYTMLQLISRSDFGLALRGVRDNPDRMQALGYPVQRLRLTAFVLASVPAALAGIFFVQFTGVITPVSLGLDRTVWLLLIVILGGIRNLNGAVIGTVIALLFEVVVTRYTDRYLTAMGLTFLLLILFAPNGITGIANSLRTKLLRRKGVEAVPRHGG